LSEQQQKHARLILVGWYWWAYQLRWVKEHRKCTSIVKRRCRQQLHDTWRHSSPSNRCSSLQQWVARSSLWL